MIRVGFIFVAACIVGLVLQATLRANFFAVGPDFLVILVVILAVSYPNAGGVLGAFCLGLIYDLGSGQFLGPNAAGSVIAFLVAAGISRKMYAERIAGLAIVVLVCSLAKSTTFALMLSAFIESDLIKPYTLQVIMMEACFSALVAPFVVWLMPSRAYSAPANSARRLVLSR
jgi:rod shape-determining protein MreD